MGDITRVLDRELEREVAVKSLRAQHLTNAESVARFVREAKTTGQLQHPNIPPVHELGHDSEGNPYFTMALVRGETLGTIVDRLARGDAETHRQFTFARRIQIMQLVCDAIHYAHSRGYLHRDLKPDNIMLGPFGEVQVMDWGLVRKITGPETRPKHEQTRVGMFVGTPEYAAPEQIAGDASHLDARTDVYGLGAMLYEFATLHPPHQGKSKKEILMSVMTGTPPRPESYHHPVQGRVSRELSAVILEAMASLPEERPESAQALKVRLQQVLEGDAPGQSRFKRVLIRLQRYLDNRNSRLLVALICLWLVAPLFIPFGLAWIYFH